MVEANQYIKTVELYFGFLRIEFGFRLWKEKINGNAFYDVQYTDETSIISVSYENIENYLQVIIFILQNGELPDYDDKTKTLHLDKLNRQILPDIGKSEIMLNAKQFEKHIPKNELEKKLLKSAKELRLCMKNFNII